MANRIILDEASKSALNQWTETSPGFVLAAYNFFERCEMILEGIPGICYCRAGKDVVIIHYHSGKGTMPLVYDDGRVKDVNIKMKIRRTPDGPNDYAIEFRLNSIAEEEFRKFPDESMLFVKLVAESYLMANAFLIYGNITESDERVIHASGKNDGKDKVITFRVLNGKVYAADASCHKGPEGIFSVRGHFRRYQSGNVIWIDDYVKGLKN